MLEKTTMGNDPRDVSFIEAVFRRPKMYTIDGSFEEMVAFLEGYFSGLAKSQSPLRLNAWGEFQVWLSAKYNIPISEILKFMRDRGSSDKERTEFFILALHEFSGHQTS